jgi:hypothetical protein
LPSLCHCGICDSDRSVILKTRSAVPSIGPQNREFAVARMLVGSDAQRTTILRLGRRWPLRSQRGEGGETAFPKTRRRGSTFPITRHVRTSPTISSVRFGDHWPIANQNANLMRWYGQGSNLSTAPVVADVLSDKIHRVFGIAPSCYQIVGTVLSDSIHTSRIAGFSLLSPMIRDSNLLTSRDNSP